MGKKDCSNATWSWACNNAWLEVFGQVAHGLTENRVGRIHELAVPGGRRFGRYAEYAFGYQPVT